MSFKKGDRVWIRGWAKVADMESSWESKFARAEMDKQICTIAYDTNLGQTPQVKIPSFHSSLYLNAKYLVRVNDLEEKSHEL